MNKKLSGYPAKLIPTLATGIFVSAAALASVVDFNNTSDLATYFNSDSAPLFSNVASGGLGNSGVVSIPSLGTDVWTAKTGESLSVGNTYTVSSYFYNNGNAGYGLMGFAISNANNPNGTIGTPLSALGMNFHGGGGAFENSSSTSTVSTPVTWGGGDLALNSWFKFTYTLTYQSLNSFDADFLIENSDVNGVVGSTRAHQSITGEINSTVGGASTLYAYFGNSGNRMSGVDNFDTAAIPEPSVLAIVGVFGAGIFGIRRFLLI